jgi:hypothetical protein
VDRGSEARVGVAIPDPAALITTGGVLADSEAAAGTYFTIQDSCNAILNRNPQFTFTMHNLSVESEWVGMEDASRLRTMSSCGCALPLLVSRTASAISLCAQYERG